MILACFDPQADGDAWEARPNPDHLYFLVDDLEEYFRRVSAQPKGHVLKAIETQPWANAASTARSFRQQALLRTNRDGLHGRSDMKARRHQQHPSERRKRMNLTPSAEGILEELPTLCLSLPEAMETKFLWPS